MLTIFFAIFFSTAHAETGTLQCRTGSENAFLRISKDADGRYHVETELTRRFLIGLTCDVPLPNEPIFFCRGPGADSLTFSSVWIRERGFPRDSYGSFVERELLHINLEYVYKNGKDEPQRLKRDWSFERSACQGSL